MTQLSRIDRMDNMTPPKPPQGQGGQTAPDPRDSKLWTREGKSAEERAAHDKNLQRGLDLLNDYQGGSKEGR